MDLFKQGMKGPMRPAPAVPKLTVNRYSPVTNWNDDPFGADVFEPMPNFTQKKKPPPRPPPPKVSKHPDVPVKPSHFIRRPTVLTSLLTRKNKEKTNECASVNQMIQQQTLIDNELDSHRLFQKCETKNVQTGTLIDLSSPPSSPTFTTRSSSDGLSVDSFGSDATTSTSHHNAHNGGNTSQAESGFEDDFELFVTTRKLPKEDTTENFANVDPFSPQSTKPAVRKKPVFNRDFYESALSQSGPQLKGPTIIRAKPARPKPPDNSALLKSTFGSSFPVTSMNINTTTPIQKITNVISDNYDSPLGWDPEEDSPQLSSSTSRESSPPMPSIPPPPPPAVVDDLPEPQVDWDDLSGEWGNLPPPQHGWNVSTKPQASWDDHAHQPQGPPQTGRDGLSAHQPPGIRLAQLKEDEPHAIALFDYFTDHPDDLNFSAGDTIKLIRRVDADWLHGSVRGSEGLFPANYVEIKVPLPNDTFAPAVRTATALYDFESDQTGDLPFRVGDTIKVRNKINDEWHFGECKGLKGQFPINYVQMS